MYKYRERLQIFRIERGRHREEYDLSMSYKFSKYILAFSCTWISKLRGPKGFSLQADQHHTRVRKVQISLFSLTNLFEESIKQEE